MAHNLRVVPPGCAFGFATEISKQFLLHCPLVKVKRTYLLSKLNGLGLEQKITTLLIGSKAYSEDDNKAFVAIQAYILATCRF